MECKLCHRNMSVNDIDGNVCNFSNEDSCKKEQRNYRFVKVPNMENNERQKRQREHDLQQKKEEEERLLKMKKEHKSLKKDNVSFVNIVVNDSLKKHDEIDNNFGTIEEDIKYDVGSGSLIFKLHGFVQALHIAFANHITLSIKPDDIYHIMLEVISSIVNENPEKYRKNLVTFEGKVELKVIRNQFQRNIILNDWESCFPEFREKISEFSKINTNLEFSSSTNIDTLISSVLIMDTFKEYFEYSVCTLCGIPTIKIIGSLEDWKRLKKFAEDTLHIFSENYSKNMINILNKFIDSFNDIHDIPFWNSIYKYNGTNGSGSPYITGWVNLLFNKTIEKSRTDHFPSTLCNVPITWKYLTEEIKLKLISGFGDYYYDEETSTIETTRIWGLSEI